MSALEQELANPGRKLICRYLRRDGYRCTNETVATPDDDVLLCPKHLFEAWQLFTAHAKHAQLRKSALAVRTSAKAGAS